MKLLVFLISFLIYSCSTKPVIEVDLTKWYNTQSVSSYDDSKEYFSFIGSNLTGKHYALMNFDKRNEKLVVTFALSEGDFDFKNNETIKVRFDGKEKEFQVHNSTNPNLVHIFHDQEFANSLSKTDTLKVDLKVKDIGWKTFKWNQVGGLQEVYYRNNPQEAIKI